jgi:hypothetical protein
MADLLVEMLAEPLEVKKCLVLLKSSRTILLFKKIDCKQPGLELDIFFQCYIQSNHGSSPNFSI